MGSAALVDAVVLPIQGSLNFVRVLIRKFYTTRKTRVKVFNRSASVATRYGMVTKRATEKV